MLEEWKEGGKVDWKREKKNPIKNMKQWKQMSGGMKEQINEKGMKGLIDNRNWKKIRNNKILERWSLAIKRNGKQPTHSFRSKKTTRKKVLTIRREIFGLTRVLSRDGYQEAEAEGGLGGIILALEIQGNYQQT